MNYNYESDLSILSKNASNNSVFWTMQYEVHHSFLQRVVAQRTNINFIFILVARRFQNMWISLS